MPIQRSTGPVCRYLSTLVVVLLLAQVVRADAWDAELAFSSDYRFRGLSRSEDKPSVRLSASYDNPEGYYLGADLSRVRASGQAGAERLFYAGRYFDWQPWYLETDLRHYQYSGNRLRDYQELTLLLGFGPLALDLALSNDFSRGQGDSRFARASVDYDLGATLALAASLGHQDFSQGDGYWVGELQLKGTLSELGWLLGYSQTAGLASEQKRLRITLSRRF